MWLGEKESLFLGGGLELYFKGGWGLERPREGTETLVVKGLCASLAGPVMPCSRITSDGNCNSPAAPGLDLEL